MPITDVIPLFPRTIVTGKSGEIDNDKIVNHLLIKFKDEKYYSQSNNFYTSESNLHEQELFKPLANSMLKFVKTSMVEVFKYEELDPYITLMWAVGIPKNCNIHKHYHPNSLYSGVYYPQQVDDYANINFYTDRKNMFLPRKTQNNNLNAWSFSITPEQGSMILFPSDLEHDTDRSDQDELRLSIAFNFLFHGKFGDVQSLTNLEL